MKITKIQISQVRCFPWLCLYEPATAAGDILLTGPSGSGKSTIIDAIAYGVGGGRGSLDDADLAPGATDGAIELVLTDEHGQTATITRRFARGGDKSVHIADFGSGDPPRAPQSWLNRLVGGEGVLDPTKIWDGTGEDLVKRLVKAFPALNTRDIDQEIERAQEARAAAKERMIAARALADVYQPIDIPPDPEPQISEETAAAELLALEAQAVARTAKLTRLQRDLRTREQQLQTYQIDLQKIRTRRQEIIDELARLDRQEGVATSMVERLEAEVLADQQSIEDLPPPPSMTEAVAARERIRKHNASVAEAEAARERAKGTWAELERLQREAREAEAAHEQRANRVDELRMDRRAKLAAAKLPIDGLEIDGGIPWITRNGVRVPVSKLSEGERLDLGVQVASTVAGPLRLIVVDNANRVDRALFERLLERCHAAGLSVLAACHEPIEGGIDVAAVRRRAQGV